MVCIAFRKPIEGLSEHMSVSDEVGEQLDERALMRSVARGDEDAVEKLYRTYADAVFAFVYRRIGGRREDSEELTLDTFLSACASAERYQGSAAVMTWLCAIARQKIADFLRRAGAQKRQEGALSAEDIRLLFSGASADWSGDASESILADIQAKEMAAALLDLLSGDEREAVLLRYYDEFSVREIGNLMGRSDKGVESLLDRAKRKQRQALAGWMRAGLAEGGVA